MPLVFYSSLHLNLKTARSFSSFLYSFIDPNSSSNGICVLFSLDNTVFRLSGEGCSQKMHFYHLPNRPYWTALIYLHHSIHWNGILQKYRYQCTKRQSFAPKNTVVFIFKTVIFLNLIFYRYSWKHLPFFFANILCFQKICELFCKGLITTISYRPRSLHHRQNDDHSWRLLNEKYFHCQK